MNWILRLLGIEKTTEYFVSYKEYFVSYKLYENGINTHLGHCHIKWHGRFDLDILKNQILLSYQKDGENFTSVIIISITKL